MPINSGTRVGDSVLQSLDVGDFDRIMQAINNEPQYQGLTAESVLRNIPRGLCTNPDDSAWLSCRFCLRNGRRLMLPNELGVTNHFMQSRHAPIETEQTEASPGRQSMWSSQHQAAADQSPPEPAQDAPPRWVPTAAVASARFGLGLPPIPAQLIEQTVGHRPFQSTTGQVGPTVATAEADSHHTAPHFSPRHGDPRTRPRLPHPRPKPQRHLPPSLHLQFPKPMYLPLLMPHPPERKSGTKARWTRPPWSAIWSTHHLSRRKRPCLSATRFANLTTCLSGSTP